MDNINYVKQSPMSMGGMGGVVGSYNFRSGASDSVYVDDVFSTEVWISAGSPKTITNGIDFAGEGGLVWTKSRSDAYNHVLSDTVRGGLKAVFSNTNGAEDVSGSGSNYVGSFNDNGVQLGTWGIVGGHSGSNGKEYATWSFREAPGFCDVVTYTGNGTAGRTISHSLGSVPGMIMVKQTSAAANWYIYHRGIGNAHALSLNTTDDKHNDNAYWNSTDPTASVFTLGNSDGTNKDTGEDYVAYVFAGGIGSTGTAVDFDGTDDYLSIAVAANGFDVASSDDLTLEAWIYIPDVSAISNNYARIFARWDLDGKYCFLLSAKPDGGLFFAYGQSIATTTTTTGHLTDNTWHHVAVTKDGTSGTIWIDGISRDTFTWSPTFSTTSTSAPIQIGTGGGGTQYCFPGKISNVRITRQALYTSSFTPSTIPFTTNSQGAYPNNVKLLCCNGTTATSSTVTLGTITANSNPSVSTTNNIFDDAGANIFGEEGDQNIIKCGSYVGASVDVHVYTGGEAQWVMIKNTSRNETDWYIVDVMRGAPAEGAENCKLLLANTQASEGDLSQLIVPTATGFTARTGAGYAVNYNGDSYVYIAIRRPDGYVGKPADAGTDVFNIDLAGINNGNPSWVSGFPVDLQFIKDRNGTTYNWFLSSRLTEGRYLSTPGTAAEITNSVYSHDYQNGWGNYASNDALNITSWMWKRHAGFDVVTYKGNSNNPRPIPHSMGVAPEMMWVRKRSGGDWEVYHKGLNGGSSPEGYAIKLNESDAEAALGSTRWASTAPTSTQFTVSTNTLNASNENYIAFLFASVDGISKVGYYAGNATDSDHSSGTNTITFGFQPRMVIIKSSDANNTEWIILDTLRGWASGSGNTKRLRLNLTNAQNNEDAGYPTSTGMVLTGNGSGLTNNSGDNYIYYAHA